MEKENNIQLINFTELFLSSAYLQQSKILRAEKIRIPFKHAHFERWLEYCFLAKNLYNTTLYHVYSQFNQNKTLIKYENLAKQFVKENNKDFRALNNNAISQQIMMMVLNIDFYFIAIQRNNKEKIHKNKFFLKNV